MEILRKISDKSGEFYIEKSGKRVAEMTFVFAGKDILIADHTWVDDSQKGLGLGKQMFDQLVKYAREQSIKILATCPYVLHELKKHREELLDVIK